MTLFRQSGQNYVAAKRYNQTELVLAVLQIKGSTTTEQFHSLGVKCPSAIIFALRKSGYDIRTKYVQRNSLENPFWVKQAEYSLLYGSPTCRALPFFYQL